MSLSLGDFNFTLQTLFGGNSQFQLKKVSPWYEFDANHTSDTKKQLGTKYQVADLKLVIKFDVKVPNNTPIIDNEALQKSATPVFVTFGNNKVSFYGKSLFECSLSVVAERIELVKPITKSTAAQSVGFPDVTMK